MTYRPITHATCRGCRKLVLIEYAESWKLDPSEKALPVRTGMWVGGTCPECQKSGNPSRSTERNH
ncbi:hypothetical protein SAMN05421854_10441 [Amycolatopsis rubida]|uniref:Uncharacterized protein n=1 Tax=Amycolatopsis rubida TaxID=112413 RepID=A0A1I5MGJ5_9PSEU|nr:hypothetical protein SAMN05421854_10441 [Amycolatopsis rubida]